MNSIFFKFEFPYPEYENVLISLASCFDFMYNGLFFGFIAVIKLLYLFQIYFLKASNLKYLACYLFSKIVGITQF